jgi:chromosome segregation ATPase
MTSELLTYDRATVAECFRNWKEDQRTLDAELNESLAALEAYQANLDAWASSLARERQQFNQERHSWELTRSEGEIDPRKLDEVTAELEAAREHVTRLTGELLTKTDELRTVEKICTELSSELDRLRGRESDLAAQLDKERSRLKAIEKDHADQLEHWRQEREQAKSQPNPPAISNHGPRLSNNPVIGSVVAQFDKLRQQQAEGRKKRLQRS